jgi:hypothetical protein
MADVKVSELPAKATPIDADELYLTDSVGVVSKKTTRGAVRSSAAEVKTDYESNADTNAFTDADEAKLDGIAAGANNYSHPNHTGDVTSVGDGAQTIAANAVSNAKAADMAQNTIKGRISAGAGDPEDLTAASVRTIINVADGAEVNTFDSLAGEDYLSLLAGVLTAESINLDNLSATGTPTSANFLRGDNTWAAPAVGAAESIVLDMRKDSAGTITKGTPVYLVGWNAGGWSTVEAADADDPAKMPALTVADQDITSVATATVVVYGNMQGMDTSSFSVGDRLYVSDTGTLTATRPANADDAIQSVGTVLRVHASAGVIQITGAGRSNAIPNNMSTDYFRVSDGIDITKSLVFDLSGISTTTERTITVPDKNLTLIGEVKDDTTPQLGGNLDINSQCIVGVFTAAEILAADEACYLNSANKMAKINAGAEGTTKGIFGWCTEALAADATGTFVLFGPYTTGLTLNAGSVYFAATTAGDITSTAPSTSGNQVRAIGQAQTTTVLFINAGMDWGEA